ncbi:Anion exchange protein, partial [Caligus rogercresseyi]
VFLAPVLALLATILIFMDQQITAVIINRKDNKLMKGCGYHLDLFVLAFLIVILSLFGLPWFVAATVESRNHLCLYQGNPRNLLLGETKVLGDKRAKSDHHYDRATHRSLHFITPVLALIPMPILYGVFLFMGVRSLGGLQFFDRLLLFLVPLKYQPDYIFLKYVPLKRLASLVGLWLIKSFPDTSIAFPVMLVLICLIRFVCGWIFSRRELRVLDDLLPGKSIVKRGAR